MKSSGQCGLEGLALMIAAFLATPNTPPGSVVSSFKETCRLHSPSRPPYDPVDLLYRTCICPCIICTDCAEHAELTAVAIPQLAPVLVLSGSPGTGQKARTPGHVWTRVSACACTFLHRVPISPVRPPSNPPRPVEQYERICPVGAWSGPTPRLHMGSARGRAKPGGT